MEPFRLFFELVFLMLRAAGSAGRGLARLIRSAGSQSWPVTAAVIQTVMCPEDDGIYSVRIDYEYCVNQQYYAGSLSHECVFPSFANRFADRFHVRAHYLVHYHPNNPSKSFLPAKPTLVQMAATVKY